MITKDIFMKYINKGFPVFPLGEDKRPIGGSWSEYMERLPTETEVDSWLAFMDVPAMGMATGKLSGILVVDIDDPEKTFGFESSVKVRTQSGGLHFWYKWRPGVRNTVKINGNPIDVRGDGGYVVVPPSQGLKGKYQWLQADFDNLPEFPEIKTEETYKPKMTDLPQASEGHRNDTAIRVAGHIVANTNQDAWETVAWPSFKSWNQEMCVPSLTERELRTTFESCCTMQKRNHSNDEEKSNIFYGEDLQRYYDRISSAWGEGLTTGYPELDGHFRFLPEHLYLVSAPTHHGKTTLALNFASRVASYGNNVLFCSLEQGAYITPNIKSILGGQIPPTFGMLDSDSLLSTKHLINSITALQTRPQLVVIDHLHFMKKDTRNGQTAGIDQMISDIQIAAKKLQLPMLVIAHLRKLNDSKAPTLDDLRDSSYLAQVPSVIIQMMMDTDLEGNIGNRGKMYLRKNRITQKKDVFNYEINNKGQVNVTQSKNTKYSLGEI